jgi:catechol 2,3-dioxygenase-like lactoylglutathione lyase family enzyme
VSWKFHRVSLTTHSLEAAARFFGDHVGFGAPRAVGDDTIAFGAGSRGLRITKPGRSLQMAGGRVLAEAGAKHVAIEIADLETVARNLDKAAIAYVEAAPGDFDIAALYTLDPACDVVAFCQGEARPVEGVQPWEAEWGWGIHHVNLQAADVREAVAFYGEIAGLPERPWRAPEARGSFSIDAGELAVVGIDDFNRGFHIIRPDAGFAKRNDFAHNPSIGGHPAIHVGDVRAVKGRLEAAGIPVSDAGVYAMYGMHQIYVLEPTANMIEVNQFV